MSSKKQNKLQNYFPAKQPGSTSTASTMENTQDPDSQPSPGQRSYLQAASQTSSPANSQEGQPNSQPGTNSGLSDATKASQSDLSTSSLQAAVKASPKDEASSSESTATSNSQTTTKPSPKVPFTPIRKGPSSKRSATPEKPDDILSPHQRHQHKARPTSIVEAMSDSAIQSPPGQVAVTPEDSKAPVQSPEGEANGGQPLDVPSLESDTQVVTDTNLEPGSSPTDVQVNSDTQVASQDQPVSDSPATTDDKATSGESPKDDEAQQPPPQDQPPPADGPPAEVQQPKQDDVSSMTQTIQTGSTTIPPKEANETMEAYHKRTYQLQSYKLIKKPWHAATKKLNLQKLSGMAKSETLQNTKFPPSRNA